MSAVGLDQVLRTLQPGGDVQFTLSAVPLDEALVTLHETRFRGSLTLGQPPEADVLYFRKGQIVRATPPNAVHMRLLCGAILEARLMSAEILREQIEADARLSAVDVAECFVLRGLVSDPSMKRVELSIAKRRLIELYESQHQSVTLREGLDAALDIDGPTLSPLPAVAHGIIAKSNPARRVAMRAYAAGKRVRLQGPYDVVRNRLGLSGRFLAAARTLDAEGAQFGAEPTLGELTTDETAGLLLAFQRMGLLVFGESTRPPSIGASVTDAGTFDERTDRFDRDVI